MIQFKFLIMTAFTILTMSIGNAQKHSKMTENGFNQDQKAVLAAVKKMTKSFHERDIVGVMNSYEANALVVFEPGNPIADAAVLKTAFESAFAINPIFDYSGHEVFVNGDMAMHIAPWHMKGKAPDGTAIEQSGLSIAILRKQEDGEWLMIFDNPHGQFLMNK